MAKYVMATEKTKVLMELAPDGTSRPVEPHTPRRKDCAYRYVRSAKTHAMTVEDFCKIAPVVE